MVRVAAPAVAGTRTAVVPAAAATAMERFMGGSSQAPDGGGYGGAIAWRLTIRTGPKVERDRFDDLGAALEALEADDLIKSAMPGRLYDVFKHYKRDEWERYLAAVTDWERDEYLEVLP